MKVVIKKSTKKGKKLMATFDDKKTIHFGAEGMSDFTIHKDPKRKERYLKRHEKRENWNNPQSAGALSRWILWNKTSLKSSIEDYKKRFKLSRSNKVRKTRRIRRSRKTRQRLKAGSSNLTIRIQLSNNGSIYTNVRINTSNTIREFMLKAANSLLTDLHTVYQTETTEHRSYVTSKLFLLANDDWRFESIHDTCRDTNRITHPDYTSLLTCGFTTDCTLTLLRILDPDAYEDDTARLYD